MAAPKRPCNRHHILPRARGGVDDGNIVRLDYEYHTLWHSAFGTQTIEETKAFLQHIAASSCPMSRHVYRSLKEACQQGVTPLLDETHDDERINQRVLWQCLQDAVDRSRLRELLGEMTLPQACLFIDCLMVPGETFRHRQIVRMRRSIEHLPLRALGHYKLAA